MSEFCLECFNKFWDKDLTENQVSLAKDFCEGCAKNKPCVIKVYPLAPKKKGCSLLPKLFKSE